MALQLNHAFGLGFGQELLLQLLVARAAANAEGHIHAGAHLPLHGAVVEAIRLIYDVVDDLRLGLGTLRHACNASVGFDPLEDKTHDIDAKKEEL